MTDPISMMAISSMALSGIGSLVGAKAQAQEGSAAREMYEYRAGMAEVNRKIALENRDYTLAVGEQEAGRYGLKARQTMGSIRAKQAASGIDISSGSAADVQAGQRYVTEIDLATIRNNTARKAYGYVVEASKEESQAGLYRKAGEEAERAGKTKAIGSLISGATSVSSKWLQGQQAGLFGGSNEPLGAT